MKIISKKHKLEIKKIENGAIVFDKSTGDYFQTNEIGVTILLMLSENMSEEEIAISLSKEFKEDLANIKEDILLFMNSLKESRII